MAVLPKGSSLDGRRPTVQRKLSSTKEPDLIKKQMTSSSTLIIGGLLKMAVKPYTKHEGFSFRAGSKKLKTPGIRHVLSHLWGQKYTAIITQLTDHKTMLFEIYNALKKYQKK